MKCFSVFVSLSLCMIGVLAHPMGAQTCAVEDTNQMGDALEMVNKWTLRASAGYAPGQSIDIYIENADLHKFKGILIYSETEDGNRAGEFVNLPADMRYVFANLACGPEKATVTQIDPRLRQSPYRLTWQPPEGYDGRIIFKASVVVKSAADWFILPELSVLPRYSSVEIVKVKGSGATFPNPIIQEWLNQFEVISSVTVRYNSIGSGDGIKDYKADAVIFAGSDAPLTTSQRQAFLDAGRKPLHIPETCGALLIAHNVPGNKRGNAPIKLKAATVGKIYNGDITMWNDAAIVADNPSMSGVSERIKLVYRSDSSGSTFVFTDYLVRGTKGGFTKPANKNGAAIWGSLSHGVPVDGSVGVAEYVKANDYALGYVESGLGVRYALNEINLENKAGKFVTTMTSDLTNGAQAATPPASDGDWGNFNIVDQLGDTTWPIMTVTYILVDNDLSTRGAAGAALVSFLRFILSDASQLRASDFGFVPLPRRFLNQGLAAVASIKLATTASPAKYALTAVGGSGAAFAAPIMQQWGVMLSGSTPVSSLLTFSSRSRTDALDALSSGVASYAALDFALAAGELSMPVIHIPAVMGPIAVVHSVPAEMLGGNQLKLDPATLAKIFSRSITKWNDAAIIKENPFMAAVSKDIILVRRSDSDSSNRALSNFFTKAAPAEWTVGGVSDMPWKLSNEVDSKVKTVRGNAGVASELFWEPYCIAGLKYIVSEKTNLQEIAVQNKAGNYVTARATLNIPASVFENRPDPSGDWSKESFDFLDGAQTFPILSVTYMVVPKDLTIKGDAGALTVALLKLINSKAGQNAAQQRGFSVIPDNQQAKSNTAIDTLTLADKSKVKDYVVRGLVGSGASFPFSVLDHWSSVVGQKSFDRTYLTYSAKGSGAGVAEYTKELTHFGASDAPLKPTEKSAMTGEILQIPETIGAVNVAHSLPLSLVGASKLKLTSEDLANIFSGKKTNWADFAANNDFLAGSSQAIKVVVRKDKSGTTFAFTDYLTRASPSTWSLGTFSSDSFPAFAIRGAGNSEVGEKMTENEYSITYIDASLSTRLGLGNVAVQNKDGNFVKVTEADVGAAAASAALPAPSGDWSAVSIVNQAGSNTWPIATLTYILTKKDLSSLGPSGSLSKTYMDFGMSKLGQYIAKSYGFSVLPKAVLETNKQTIRAQTSTDVPNYITGVVGAGNINVAQRMQGSSALLINAIAENIRLGYFSIVSNEAQRDYADGILHYATSIRAMPKLKLDEMKATGRNPMTMAIGGVAVSIIYNIPGATDELMLSAEHISKIFTVPETTFNDIGLANITEPLTVFAPFGDSDSTYILTEYMNGRGKGVFAGLSKNVVTFVEGGDGELAGRVRRKPFSIGYVVHGAEQNLRVARMQSSDEKFYRPSPVTVSNAIAAASSTFPADSGDWSTVSAINIAGAYPITGVALLFVDKDQTANQAEGSLLKTFLTKVMETQCTTPFGLLPAAVLTKNQVTVASIIAGSGPSTTQKAVCPSDICVADESFMSDAGFTCANYTDPASPAYPSRCSGYDVINSCCSCETLSEGVGGAEGGGFVFAGCKGGAGSFQFKLNIKKELKKVGVIPVGQVDLRVSLKALSDLDIQIYDVDDTSEFQEGKALVAWCKKPCNIGLINSGGMGTTEYKGMTIEYSGYNGVDKNKGDEYIKITGKTTTRIQISAYAYDVGDVDVAYSWSKTETECCLGTAACTGAFTKSLKKGEIMDLGDIPKGVKDLQIQLTAEEDIDIQLYDKDAGFKAVVAYCPKKQTECECEATAVTCKAKGVLGNSGTEASADWMSNTYTYSGYNGVAERKGNEFIKIKGVSQVNLFMKIFGYKAGKCDVSYSYWENV